jgi:glutathione S-transferase
LSHNDPAQWQTQHLDCHEDALHWVKICDQEFKLNLDRYKYPNRYDLADGNAHREQGAVYIKQLEERLSQTANLMGSSWTWVDAAIAPFVRQFARTDRTWFDEQAWPAVQKWLEIFEQSPEFQAVMHKYKVWHHDAKPVAFPASTPTK